MLLLLFPPTIVDRNDRLPVILAKKFALIEMFNGGPFDDQIRGTEGNKRIMQVEDGRIDLTSRGSLILSFIGGNK